MKLLLVIDVADDVAEAYEDFTVDYDLRGTPKEDRAVNESIKYVEDCLLKPLPDCPEVPDTIANDVAYIIGWNDCLVEISKEQKEAKSLIRNEKESVSNANGTSIK